MIDYAFKASIGLVHRVPSGLVRMGSHFHPREQPPRSVYVQEFQIAHAPVTVNQYKVFLDSGAMEEKRWWREAGWAWRNGEIDGWGREDRSKPDGWSIQHRRYHHPVTGISYYEAEAYCSWLAHHKKKTVRLPAEEEWERAARGEDRRPYPWGEVFDPNNANTLEGGREGTVHAGSIQGDRSPFGLSDLAGNAQEWTASTYQPLTEEQFPKGALRAVRGGSYNDTAFGARTSYRRGYPEGYFYPFLGFRVVVGIR